MDVDSCRAQSVSCIGAGNFVSVAAGKAATLGTLVGSWECGGSRKRPSGVGLIVV